MPKDEISLWLPLAELGSLARGQCTTLSRVGPASPDAGHRQEQSRRKPPPGPGVTNGKAGDTGRSGREGL